MKRKRAPVLRVWNAKAFLWHGNSADYALNFGISLLIKKNGLEENTTNSFITTALALVKGAWGRRHPTSNVAIVLRLPSLPLSLFLLR